MSLNSYFSSFYSLSHTSTVRSIELGIGVIELGIHVCLRINKARRNFLARDSALVRLLLLLTIQISL